MFEVVHNEAEARFEVRAEGQLAMVEYARRGTMVSMHHTYVPPALRHHGIAAEMVRVALAWAKAEGLAVEPTCSYVAAYLRRHPDAAAVHIGPH